MAKVVLDTDSVLSVSKGMDTLASNADTVLSNIKSYDVANNDFDFSGAKAAIVNNIEGIETKVSNTNILLDTVVQVHTELQESVANLADGADDSSSSSTLSTSSAGVSSGGYTYDSGSSYSSNEYYYTPTTQDYENYGMGGNSDEWQEYYSAAATETTNIDNAKKIEEAKAILEEAVEEKTDADISKKVVSSIVEEEYKQVLEETKFEETTVTNLLNTLRSGEMCIVVEGNSTDLKTIEYLSVVAKAAMSVTAIMRFVKLDNILDFKTNSTASDMSESTKNVLKDEEKEETEKKEEKKEEEKETKVEALNYSVKDKTLLDALSSIKCVPGIEISYEKLPITLIAKNNVILSFKTGIVSEEELRKELLRIDVIPTSKT